MILIKLSAPGWEKEFATEEQARDELYKHICDMCRQGNKYESEDGIAFVEDPVDEHSNIDALLATPCGCEFTIE